MTLRPSPRLATAIGVGFAAGAAMAWRAWPTTAGMVLAFLIASLGIATAWDRALLRSRKSPQRLALGSDGRDVVELADGGVLRVRAAGHWVHRICVVLALEGPFRRHLLVAQGMLDAEDFRRLRQWALWRRVGASRANSVQA